MKPEKLHKFFNISFYFKTSFIIYEITFFLEKSAIYFLHKTQRRVRGALHFRCLNFEVVFHQKTFSNAMFPGRVGSNT